MKKENHILFLFLLFFIAVQTTTAQSLPDTSPWDLAALSEAPGYEWADQDSLVWSLYYKGEPYQGQASRVFAYYASPTTIKAKDTLEKYPAVVLVHGGGGKAFKEWARLWAERGYAAIAMDLGGCGPDRKPLPDGGPNQSDTVKFGAIDQAPENQWTYHAVANVILAHSLIRTFEEVDATRTAITGISWGGYLTCIIAGLDSRFKAAVPVYGCGFLYENSFWLDNFAKMTKEQKDKWVQLWDPSMYVGSATMPMFFINGTNDFAYPLDSYAKTYGLVKSERDFRITVKMPHGHQAGWAPPEIGMFIDQYLKGSAPLPAIVNPQLDKAQVQATVRSETPLDSAQLHYTTGTGPINQLDWVSISASLEGNQINSPALPNDATIWFLTVKDDRGACISSEVVFTNSYNKILPVSSGLVLDLNADRGLILEENKMVTSWTNQAPEPLAVDFRTTEEGRTKTIISQDEPGTGRPSLMENSPEINGHNSLVFRENELINDNDEAFHGMMTGAGYTWFAVIKPYEQGGPGKINSRYPNAFFGCLRNSGPPQKESGQYAGFWGSFYPDGRVYMGSRNGLNEKVRDSVNTPEVEGPPPSVNEWHIIMGRQGSGQGTVLLDLFVDDPSEAVNSSDFPVGDVEPSRMAIGTERNAINHQGKESFDGELARLLMYETALGQQEMKEVYNYLRRVYFD